jgi:tRNA-dihydrouridine synthase
MKLYAAPLQGFTEAPWRNLHQEVFGGIDAYYTPFVRMEKGEFRNKDVREIASENNTVSRLIPQLIASTPAELVYRERVQGSGYQYGLSFSPDDRET